MKKINKIRRKENILTHFIPVGSSTIICWTSPFVFLGGWVYFVPFILFLIEKVG